MTKKELQRICFENAEVIQDLDYDLDSIILFHKEIEEETKHLKLQGSYRLKPKKIYTEYEVNNSLSKEEEELFNL